MNAEAQPKPRARAHEARQGLRELMPHFTCIVSLALLYKSWLVGGALLVGLVVALAYLRANTPTFIWQLIYALGGGAIAYILARVLDGRLAVELCALFVGGAIGRLPLAAPVLRGRLDFLLFAFAMVALGASREPGKTAYAAASVALALALAWSAGEVSPTRLIKDHPVTSVLVLAVASALAGALSWVTPRMTGGRFLANQGGAQTGFSNRVHLGGASGLETSDVIVLRIRGGHTDYLRGAVMDSFSFERDAWYTSRANVTFTGGGKGPIAVSSVKPTMHLFAPLGSVGISDGAIRNAYGVTSVAVGISDYTIDTQASSVVDPPAPRDTELPEALKKRIVPLATLIVGDEKDDRKRLRLLEAYLSRNFTYTLSRSKAQKDRSAIMDFLLWNREGHCEYFASALALLARALDIPARIVAGYRVVETNPYGGYDVVRERNAHAWVEVWDRGDAQWHTEDPTPVTEAMSQRSAEDASALLDAAREKLAGFGQMLAERRALLLGALGLLSIFLLSRRFFARPKRDARAVEAASHRMFTEVSDALARLGLTRASWEGIEAFAERVKGAGHEEAARVLVHYAEMRYDPAAATRAEELENELRSLLTRLTAPRTAERT